MFPLPVQSGNSRSSSSQRLLELPALPKPYMKVPAIVTLAVLKGYLVDRLMGKKGESSRLPPIVFQCGGQELADDSMTISDVQDKIWKQSSSSKAKDQQMMLIYYAAEKEGAAV